MVLPEVPAVFYSSVMPCVEDDLLINDTATTGRAENQHSTDQIF